MENMHEHEPILSDSDFEDPATHDPGHNEFELPPRLSSDCGDNSAVAAAALGDHPSPVAHTTTPLPHEHSDSLHAPHVAPAAPDDTAPKSSSSTFESKQSRAPASKTPIPILPKGQQRPRSTVPIEENSDDGETSEMELDNHAVAARANKKSVHSEAVEKKQKVFAKSTDRQSDHKRKKTTTATTKTTEDNSKAETSENEHEDQVVAPVKKSSAKSEAVDKKQKAVKSTVSKSDQKRAPAKTNKKEPAKAISSPKDVSSSRSDSAQSSEPSATKVPVLKIVQEIKKRAGTSSKPGSVAQKKAAVQTSKKKTVPSEITSKSAKVGGDVHSSSVGSEAKNKRNGTGTKTKAIPIPEKNRTKAQEKQLVTVPKNGKSVAKTNVAAVVGRGPSKKIIGKGTTVPAKVTATDPKEYAVKKSATATKVMKSRNELPGASKAVKTVPKRTLPETGPRSLSKPKKRKICPPAAAEADDDGDDEVSPASVAVDAAEGDLESEVYSDDEEEQDDEDDQEEGDVASAPKRNYLGGIACSSVDVETRELLEAAITSLGGYCVAPAEEAQLFVKGNVRRGPALLTAIARGIPVVDSGFLTQAITDGRWPSDWLCFETHEGAKQSRLSKSRGGKSVGFLKDKRIKICGKLAMDSATLSLLIRESGGRVVSMREDVVVASDKDAAHGGLNAVSLKWFADSVEEQRILPFDGYRIRT